MTGSFLCCQERESDKCKLCSKKQMLLHVLNNSERALQLHCYNTWHDTILNPIINRVWKTFLRGLSTTTIVESHKMWCTRNKVFIGSMTGSFLW